MVNVHALSKRRPVNAEIQQAEYFLTVLGQERAELAERLAHHRTELLTYEHAGDLAGVRRKKRMMRPLEREVAEIELMVSALSLVGADGIEPPTAGV